MFRSRTLPALIVFGVAALAFAADGFDLSRRSAVDSVAKFRQEISYTIEDESISFVQEATERVTAIDAENGDITLQVNVVMKSLRVADEEIPLDGEEPAEDELTAILRRNGELRSLSPKDSPADEEEEQAFREGVRVAAMGGVVAPDRRVRIGEVWNHEIAAREKEGLVAASLRFEAVAEETVQGKPALKVRVTGRESEGSAPIEVEGHHWISVENGLVLKYDLEMKNLPLLGEVFEGKLKSEWIP